MKQKELKELLYYDQESGYFIWLVDKGPIKMLAVAGTRIDGVGVEIKIGGKRYPAHRLAFLYVNGVFPDGKVRHLNGINDDNRWSNLHEKVIVPNPGITLCDMTGMWRDEDGNYWTTLKDANKYASTMHCCHGCMDCSNCTDCHVCTNCHDLLSCHHCTGCVDCHHCTGCKGCHHSDNCIDGVNLIAQSSQVVKS